MPRNRPDRIFGRDNLESGDLDRASEHLETAIDLSFEHGRVHHAASFLAESSKVAAASELPELADELLGRAISITIELGREYRSALFLADRAVLAIKLGKIEAAREHWNRAKPVLDSKADPRSDRVFKSLREACAAAGIPPFDVPDGL